MSQRNRVDLLLDLVANTWDAGADASPKKNDRRHDLNCVQTLNSLNNNPQRWDEIELIWSLFEIFIVVCDQYESDHASDVHDGRKDNESPLPPLSCEARILAEKGKATKNIQEYPQADQKQIHFKYSVD